jgi:hypothetical protein
MTDKEYLFYFLSNTPSEHNSFKHHRHFDMKKVKITNNLDEFINDKSLLQKIVYVREHIISRDLLIDSIKFKNLNSLFVIDFSDGTSVHTIEKLKNWIEKNQILEEKILIMTHSEHEQNLITRIIGKKQINIVVVPGPIRIALGEFLGKRYKKRFLFLSRNWSLSRLISFVDLKKRGILENCYYSFFNVKNIYLDPNTDLYDYYSMAEIEDYFAQGIQSINATNPRWATELHEYWNDEKIKIVEDMPYLLDNETKEVPGRPGQQFISNTLQDAFTNSAMSLLVETNNFDTPEHFQCTEKTYKSMIYRHPFFVYATKHHLKRTCQYGFKTFFNVFDESYDTLDQWHDRIYNIHNQVEILNNMSDTEFKKTICKTIPETTHNYNLVMNMLIDNKSSIKYQKFDKIFDNLLLDHLPDYLFNNQY